MTSQKEILKYISQENSIGKREKGYVLLAQFPDAKFVLRNMVRVGLLESRRDYQSHGPGQRENFLWYEITARGLDLIETADFR